MFPEDDLLPVAPPAASFFHTHPAVRLLLGIACGIALGLISAWSAGGFIVALAVLIASSGALALFSVKYPAVRGAAYWLGAVAAGVWIAFNAEGASLRVPDKILPEMKGILNGRIERILRQDSAAVRCIVSGSVDPLPLPRMSGTRVLLRISRLTAREQSLTVGSRIAATVYLQTPQRPTLPGEFDEAAYCRSLDALFTARAAAANVAILGQDDGLRAWSHRTARSISRALDGLFAPAAAPLMNALLLGDKTRVPAAVRQNFALTGTAHVIAVSGLHVGLIIAVLWIPAAFIPNRWARLVALLAAIGMFVLISGMQPSAIRAAVMAGVMLTARALERQATLLNAVCFAAIVMLLADASLLYSAGFQMSFAAVAGLGIFLQPFRRFFRETLRMKSGIAGFAGDSLAVTFAASSVTSVVVAVYFGMFSVASPAANLLVVPLTSCAMIFGVVALLFYPVSVGIASLFAATAQGCVESSAWLVENIAGIGGAAVQSPAAIAASVAAAACSAYIFWSQSLRAAAFRVVVCGVGLVSGYPLLFPAAVPEGVLVAPRRDVTAIIASHSGKSYVILTDRRPHQEPRGDAGLEGYLAALPDPPVIAYRGNIAEWIAVQTRRRRPAAMLPMPESVRRAADSLLGEPMPQMNRLP